MSKVLLLVEGQTEERFVKSVLARHLGEFDVQLVPVIVATKRLLTGDKIRGGYVPYSRLRGELLRLLNDSSAIGVTTMLDYHGLSPEFPGRVSPVGKDAFERVHFVEQAWARDIENTRFLPYLALHEFEAMLFASPVEAARALGQPTLLSQLQSIRNAFAKPEEIDDGSPPSRRLIQLFPSYNKPFFGERIAEQIGIPTIRSECAHFDGWLRKLESFGRAPDRISLPE